MTIYRVPVNLTWPGTGGPGVNVWHVRTDTDWVATPAYLQAAVDAIHDFYEDITGQGTTGGDWMASDFAADLGTVVDVETAEMGSPQWTKVQGAGQTTNAPSVIQVCISWTTSIAARRGRGRTFVGPLQGGAIEANGSVNEACLTSLRAAAQKLIDASSAANGWAIGVYGLAAAAPQGTVDYAALPHVLRDIQGYSIKDKFAVLRGRRD